jgi:hypothetical protein
MFADRLAAAAFLRELGSSPCRQRISSGVFSSGSFSFLTDLRFTSDQDQYSGHND